MPQDTLYVPNGAGDTLPDSLPMHISHGLINQSEPSAADDEPPAEWAFLFVLVLFVSLFSLGKLVRYLQRSSARIQWKKIPDEQLLEYHAILTAGNPYYQQLSPDLKQKFLRRTLLFMAVKKFHYVDLKPEPRMPLLISSVAIQITFGLENYLLDYFKNIYVMRTNYHFGLSHVPFEGHVNGLGIYLSWNNFENAFNDYTDGNNVGLHEMAHALTYVNFTARVGGDPYFGRRFKEFSKTGRKLFQEMQLGRRNMLGTYASTNYHEFWAVCIENFFERPGMLKKELPELYQEICLLLNQDLLEPNGLIITEKRA